MAAISLREVTKRYPDGTEAVSRLTLDIADGEFMILVGPSGCGKSTLLRIINGILPATSGQVLYNGQQVDGINPECAMVFQSFALLPWLSVKANIELGLEARRLPPVERERLATHY
ncbi:MAG: ATP-binding cassette domain-containing protein, partial [Candidatus Dormibacteria bacterium]